MKTQQATNLLQIVCNVPTYKLQNTYLTLYRVVTDLVVLTDQIQAMRKTFVTDACASARGAGVNRAKLTVPTLDYQEKILAYNRNQIELATLIEQLPTKQHRKEVRLALDL